MADPTDPRLEMHPNFRFFPATIVPGDPVQIQMDWLDNAAGVMNKKFVGDTPTLRILELALPSDGITHLDFHLSFKCSSNFAQQGHFCLRRDVLGQNACLYWFYGLVRSADGELAWSWQGCAGQGDSDSLWPHRVPGIVYGTTADDVLERLLAAMTGPKHTLTQHARRWTLAGP